MVQCQLGSPRVERAFSMETVVSDYLDSMDCLQAPIDEPAIEAGADESAKAVKLRQFFTRALGLASLGQIVYQALVEDLRVGVEGREFGALLRRAKASTETS